MKRVFANIHPMIDPTAKMITPMSNDSASVFAVI
jgi:hypothetical protein